MNRKPNPYETLGVAHTATDDEIKRAYRRLARRYHPDGESADADAFVQVKDAYELLSDPQRRDAYDASRTKQPRRPAATVSRKTHVRRSGTAVDIAVDVGEVVEDVVEGVVGGLRGLLGKPLRRS
jgi:DnaJ-class molecular chaperone